MRELLDAAQLLIDYLKKIWGEDKSRWPETHRFAVNQLQLEINEIKEAPHSAQLLFSKIAALIDKMDDAVHGKNNFTMYEALTELRQYRKT